MKRITIALASVILVAVSFVSSGSDIPATTAQLQGTASANPAFAWAKTWGGSSTNDNVSAGPVAVDGAGNLYVVGQFAGMVDFDPGSGVDNHTSNGDADASLSKFDSSGKFLWAKTWGGSKRDVAYGVGVDSAGNAYVVGPFRGTVDFDPDPAITNTHTSNATSDPVYENNIYLSKFAPDGTLQWVRTWGPTYITGSFGAEGYSIAVDGNYLYVVGDFSGDQTDFNPWGSHDWHTNHLPTSGPIFFDAFLSKFDLNGNFQWAKTWGGEGYDDGPGVAVDGAHNVYVAGMYASQNINFDPAGGNGGLGHPAHNSGSQVDVFLSKFDASGNFQWVKTWGGQDTEEATGTVVVDGENNVYVAGRFACVDCNFNPDPNGTPDIHSTHNPAPPNSTWQRQYEALDAFLSKFTEDGAFQWAKTWGGNGWDNATGLAVNGLGDVYASGWFTDTADLDPGAGVDTHNSNGQRDAFLSQFDSSGNFQWAKSWGGSGDESSDVTVDGVDNVYASGEFFGTVDFDPSSGVDNHTSNGGSDAFLSKFLPPTAMQVSPSALTYLAEPTFLARTFTLQINSSSIVTFTWTATFTPTTPTWVSAQPLSGQSGQTLTVVITPTVTVGNYQTNLQVVSSDPQIQNNDQTVPILLDVVNHVYTTYLPLIQKGGS